ncbi:MAG: MBL fold metallo-hydrolase [bacterium]|nr:MBL fold metallo-hydrolase [bacterium]
MNITYLSHSGFLTETSECYYLFDYDKGTLPPLNPVKPVLVLVSHCHADHYNPAVFETLSDIGMKEIGAILPNDIKRSRYPKGLSLLDADRVSADGGCTDMDALSGHILRVYHSREYRLPHGALLKTLLSTDSGVAFLLVTSEGTFFHAGDLNDWITEDMPETERRQMTGSYWAALRALEGTSLDDACLPLDPHLGSHCADGFLYFLKKIDVKKVWPMHFWDRPETVDQFVREHPEYEDMIQRQPPAVSLPG